MSLQNAALCCAWLALGSIPAFASQYVEFDPQGSVDTFPLAVNNSGKVVGLYYDSNLVTHGFLRDAGGSITIISGPPGALRSAAAAINSAGAIVGTFTDALGTHGFLRDPSGNYTTLDYPGGFSTGAEAISNNGLITGEATQNNQSVGFIRDAAGNYSAISAPHSRCATVAATQFSCTYPIAINSAGSVAGYFYTVDNTGYGFVFHAPGAIKEFKAPGAGAFPEPGTYPHALNENTSIAGYFTTANGSLMGFIHDLQVGFTEFQVVVNQTRYDTTALAINLSGAVAGQYIVRSGINYITHGFVRDATGKIDTFDAPGAAQGTSATAMNDNGIVTGAFIDSGGVQHGYLRYTPD